MATANAQASKQLSAADVVKEFKRLGKFDQLRKQLLAEYSNSTKGQEFLENLSNLDIQSDYMNKLSAHPSFNSLGKDIAVISEERELQIKLELSEIFQQLASKTNE